MAQLEVQVSPTVILSVADHRRRILADGGPENRRVLGCLIGTCSEGTVRVTTSFPVPFSEARGQDGVFYIDMLYQKKMLSLYQRVYHFEGVVGWYTSGTAIQVADMVIHEHLGFKNDHTKVLLCVDCTELSSDIDVYRPCIRAYAFATVNGVISAHLIASKVMVSDVERVVLSGDSATDNSVSTGAITSHTGSSTFPMQIRQYSAALQILEEEIRRIISHLEEREADVDPEILVLVQETINLLLGIDVTELIGNEHRAMACGYVVSDLVQTVLAVQKVIGSLKPVTS